MPQRSARGLRRTAADQAGPRAAPDRRLPLVSPHTWGCTHSDTAADDQSLGRSDRCRCPEAFHHETYKRLNQHDQSCDEQYRPEHTHGCPVRHGLAQLPPRQQPRDQAHNGARSHQEEHRAADCGCYSAHGHSSLDNDPGPVSPIPLGGFAYRELCLSRRTSLDPLVKALQEGPAVLGLGFILAQPPYLLDTKALCPLDHLVGIQRVVLRYRQIGTCLLAFWGSLGAPFSFSGAPLGRLHASSVEGEHGTEKLRVGADRRLSKSPRGFLRSLLLVCQFLGHPPSLFGLGTEVVAHFVEKLLRQVCTGFLDRHAALRERPVLLHKCIREPLGSVVDPLLLLLIHRVRTPFRCSFYSLIGGVQWIKGDPLAGRAQLGGRNASSVDH